MNEQYYEKQLNIKTSGEQKTGNESSHYHIYEPTPYSALEALSKQYTFSKEDHIIDFGCGKGRFSFYGNYFFDAAVTGIEMNPFFYQQAVENKKEYLKKQKRHIHQLAFFHCFAEAYEVQPFHNTFYFFNPFSLQIFIKVIDNILLSIEKTKRNAKLILYYPSYDYTFFLENTPFTLLDEISVPCSNHHDPRNRFLIYRFAP